MKSVKKVVLPMVLVAMAALTACGGEKSAENQADCKVAYAENGEWYSWIDRDAKWGKEIFKDNNIYSIAIKFKSSKTKKLKLQNLELKTPALYKRSGGF